MRVAVVGGGPSGLKTLKHLLTDNEFFPGGSPIEARLFEAEKNIGGTFKYRTYEKAELVSSRQLTTFSDYRYSSPAPDFLSAEQYCHYLEGYVKTFQLSPNIYLNTLVTKIERAKDGNGHVVHYQDAGKMSGWACDAVAICTGLHVTPNIPSIPGLGRVPMIMHSSEFKSSEQFGVGKNILVVGSGETGMDIAYLAVMANTKSVTLCHSDGFLCASKRAPDPSFFGTKPTLSPQGNVPYDVGAASLFDTSYVHPILRDSWLPWAYYDRFTKYTTWLVSGTAAGLDQWIGEISPERFHASKIFFNKSTNAMPYISAQYRKSSILNTIRSFVAQVPIVNVRSRKIELAPWPKYIDEKGTVTFIENGRPEAETMRNKVYRPDIVILATGYTQSFPFIDEGYPLPQEAQMRGIWREGSENVGFIGFIRPSFGAIPPLSELQAQLWIMKLLNRLPSSLTYEDHYRLRPPRSSRIWYGVDHEAYAYQLALDMGSAPSFKDVWALGLKMTACWALSAQVNTKFRIVGPWRWRGAKEVMETEIWETVTRRRWFFGHLTLSILPMMLFGFLSAVLYVLSALATIPKRIERVFLSQKLVFLDIFSSE